MGYHQSWFIQPDEMLHSYSRNTTYLVVSIQFLLPYKTHIQCLGSHLNPNKSFIYIIEENPEHVSSPTRSPSCHLHFFTIISFQPSSSVNMEKNSINFALVNIQSNEIRRKNLKEEHGRYL